VKQYWSTKSLRRGSLPEGRLHLSFADDQHLGRILFGNPQSHSDLQSHPPNIPMVHRDHGASVFYSIPHSHDSWLRGHDLLKELQTTQIDLPEPTVASVSARRLRLAEALNIRGVSDLPMSTLVLRNAVLSDDLREIYRLIMFLAHRRAIDLPPIALQFEYCEGPWEQAIPKFTAGGLATAKICR
jgi:hypothetical protein